MKATLRKTLTILLAAGMTAVSCDDIDCTLNNTVECKLAFYDGAGNAVQIKDTLDIYAEGIDLPLFNKGTEIGSIGIPLSYFKDKDTLQLVVYGDGYMYEDWLVITKQNIEHFESLNCPVKMFHTLTDVSVTGESFIDSVSITNPKVEYNNGENIKIYLHSGN